MDSYSIFKRLASGAKFSKKNNAPEIKKKVSANDESASDTEEEDINAIRRKYGITARGKGIPPPITTFDKMQDENLITSKLRQNVSSCKYNSPTPIQMQAVPIMSSQKQILACAPTGSGKTAAFLLPVLTDIIRNAPKPNSSFRVLIVCPTQELSQQTYRECVQLSEGSGLKPHLIKKVTASIKFGPKYSEKFDILICTPNRLIYLMRREDGTIKFNDLKWLIVDEADKMFEDGKTGFHEQLGEIISSFDMSKIKVGMFSATYMHGLYQWCRKNIPELITVIVGGRNKTGRDIEQELIYVGNESGKLIAFRELVQKGLSPPVLVFVQSKERAKELFSELIYDGIFVDVIHGDRTTLQRENVVEAFRAGKIWVLICTELMGRGIDFKGVQLVINYDFPSSVVSYIHCIGRTGRAGRPGKAVTFFTNDDKPRLNAIAQALRQAGCPVPNYMMSFKKMHKSERKRIASSVPEREAIRTKLKKPRKKRKVSSTEDSPAPDDGVSENNDGEWTLVT